MTVLRVNGLCFRPKAALSAATTLRQVDPWLLEPSLAPAIYRSPDQPAMLRTVFQKRPRKWR